MLNICPFCLQPYEDNQNCTCTASANLQPQQVKTPQPADPKPGSAAKTQSPRTTSSLPKPGATA